MALEICLDSLFIMSFDLSIPYAACVKEYYDSYDDPILPAKLELVYKKDYALIFYYLMCFKLKKNGVELSYRDIKKYLSWKSWINNFMAKNKLDFVIVYNEVDSQVFCCRIVYEGQVQSMGTGGTKSEALIEAFEKLLCLYMGDDVFEKEVRKQCNRLIMF